MTTKIQTAIRLNEDLLKALKEKAKADKRSLNNYIEKLLYQDVENIPNEITISSIKEAREGNLEQIKNLEDWLEKL